MSLTTVPERRVHPFEGTPAPAATVPARRAHVRAETRVRVVAPRLVDVLICVIGVIAVVAQQNATAKVVAVAFLLLVPGDLLRRALRIDAETMPTRIVLAAAASIVSLLVLLLAVQISANELGVRQPLRTAPLTLGLIVMLLALLASSAGSRAASPPVQVTWSTLARGALLALAPMLAALGTAVLDSRADPTLVRIAIGVGVSVVLVAGVAPDRWVSSMRPWALYAAALCIGWSFALRSSRVFGFDIHAELVWAEHTSAAGSWSPSADNAYAAMLSITALPAGLAELTGISVISLLTVVYPLLFALYPVATFVVVARWCEERFALLLSVVVTFVPAALWQMPAIARQEIALVIFGALLVIILGGVRRTRGSVTLAATLSVGVVLTHYTTAYVATGALTAAVVLSMVFRRRVGTTDRLVHPAIPAVMISTVVIWNVVITHSTSNIEYVADTVTSQGLGMRETNESFVSRFLNATVSAEEPAARTFEDARAIAARQTWLQPYPPEQATLFAATDSLAPELQPRVTPNGANAIAVGMTVLRQGWNVLVIGSIIALTVSAIRRRAEPGAAASQDLAALAIACIGLALALRVTSSLAQTYNPERLALQVGPVLAIAVVIALRRLRERRPPWSAPRRAIAATASAGVLAVLLVDASGFRAMIAGGDAGNLRADGEYVERFYQHDSDVAAAEWLNDRRTLDSLTYADRYAALMVADDTRFPTGLLDLLTPVTLDQRGLVFASASNVIHGRARVYLEGSLATFVFPREFFDLYKSRIYTTGTSEVYG